MALDPAKERHFPAEVAYRAGGKTPAGHYLPTALTQVPIQNNDVTADPQGVIRWPVLVVLDDSRKRHPMRRRIKWLQLHAHTNATGIKPGAAALNPLLAGQLP